MIALTVISSLFRRQERPFGVGQSYPIKGFEKASFEGAFKVTHVPSSRTCVFVEGDAAVQGDIVFQLIDGHLKVTRADKRKGSVRLRVESPPLRQVSVSGGCEFTTAEVESSKFIGSAFSGGILRLLRGKGDLQAVDLFAFGSRSRVDASELVCMDAKLEVMAGGSIGVHATRSARSEVRGSGKIRVFGRPPLNERTRTNWIKKPENS